MESNGLRTYSNEIKALESDYPTIPELSKKLKEDTFGHDSEKLLEKFYPGNPSNDEMLIYMADYLNRMNEAHIQLRDAAASEAKDEGYRLARRG